MFFFYLKYFAEITLYLAVDDRLNVKCVLNVFFGLCVFSHFRQSNLCKAFLWRSMTPQ